MHSLYETVVIQAVGRMVEVTPVSFAVFKIQLCPIMPATILLPVLIFLNLCAITTLVPTAPSRHHSRRRVTRLPFC